MNPRHPSSNRHAFLSSRGERRQASDTRHRKAWRIAAGLIVAALAVATNFTSRASPPALVPTSAPAASYPQQTLTNGVIKVMVYLPDAKGGYSRGARFDWSGMVGRVNYRGHDFYSEWQTPHNPEFHDHAIGPAEEFGMQVPLGYLEAKPGDTFLKIGIGRILRKAEDSYGFWNAYTIVEPLPFTITHGEDWIQFEQDAPVQNGFGYHYVKRIALEVGKPTFTITHTLKNTGTKAIDTNWYCHNFTLIDHDQMGTNYQLEFGFDPKEVPAFKDTLQADGRKLTFIKDLKDSLKADFGNGQGTKEEDLVTVRNTRTGAAIEISGDRPLKTMAFYATSTTICPEPFLEFHIGSDKQEQWKTQYRFAAPQETR